jgi:excisionase family DNA binding protein
MDDNIYVEKLASAGKRAESEVRFSGFGGSLVGGLSVEEAARFLGIGRSLIFEEIKAGRLIARKAGRRTIITYDDAVAYLHSLPVVGTTAA